MNTIDRAGGYAGERDGGYMVPALVLALVLLATWFGLRSSLQQIHANWSGAYGQFAHGYLVLAFSIWLGVQAWRGRGPLLLAADWRAAPVLLVLLALLWASIRLEIVTTTQSLAPAILLVALTLAFGLQLARLFWWAFVCLYFAMPAWWIINTPLQLITGKAAAFLVGLSGIPVIVSGHSFELPAGIVEVASGCSGLNYLISALSLAYLHSMLFLRTWPARLKLLAVAALSAMVLNWLRVFSLIWIAYATNMQHYLIRVDHLYYGWALFLLVLVPIFWTAARLEAGEARAGLGRDAQAASAPPPIRIKSKKVIIGGAAASLMLLLPWLAS